MIKLYGANGAYVEMLEYGATVVSIWVPDKNGILRDVNLGYESVEAYKAEGGFVGATIGRNINRIANSQFVLNGQEYQLEATENAHNLHAGPVGFDKKVWSCQAGRHSALFTLISPDGDQGFPGELSVAVLYTFDETNTLTIEYFAKSDRDTVCCLSNHCYFNLDGQDSGKTIKGHSLQIMADEITENGNTNIPTGRFLPVHGTAFDFRQPKKVGEGIDNPHENMYEFSGFDHNYVLREIGWKKAAVLQGESSGIRLTVMTDMPGIHLYTGNYITPRKGKMGSYYTPYSGLCLETQYFPNGINQEGFPSPILRAGEIYLHKTAYCFEVEKP